MLTIVVGAISEPATIKRCTSVTTGPLKISNFHNYNTEGKGIGSGVDLITPTSEGPATSCSGAARGNTSAGVDCWESWKIN